MSPIDRMACAGGENRWGLTLPRTGRPTAGCVRVFEWRETGRMFPAFAALGRAEQ